MQDWTQQVSEDAEGVVTFTYRHAPSSWQSCTPMHGTMPQQAVQSFLLFFLEDPAMVRGIAVRCRVGLQDTAGRSPRCAADSKADGNCGLAAWAQSLRPSAIPGTAHSAIQGC